MNRIEKLSELRNYQAMCDSIRLELEISAPGEVVFLAAMNLCSNDTIVVKADGFGGATTGVIEGNYPIDYITKHERFFANEAEATRNAEALAFEGAKPNLVLGD